MKTTNALLALATIACFFGCSAQTADGSATEQASAEGALTETVVHLKEDGTSTIVTRTISLEEEKRQIAVRDARIAGGAGKIANEPALGTAAEALSADGSCAGADFWLYDQDNRTGNKICFAGTGLVHLADFKDCSPGQDPATCPTWAQNVGHHSYWAGSSGGHWQDAFSNCTTPDAHHCPNFTPYQVSNFLSFCEAIKPDLNVGDNYCIPPYVSVDWQSPETATGVNFTPGGTVTVQVLSSTNSVVYNLSAKADANGNVSYYGIPGYKGGIQCQGNNCGSCSETIKMIDVTTGISATTASHVCSEPAKS